MRSDEAEKQVLISQKKETKLLFFLFSDEQYQSFLVLRPKGAQLSNLFLQMFSFIFKSSNAVSLPKDSNKINLNDAFISSKLENKKSFELLFKINEEFNQATSKLTCLTFGKGQVSKNEILKVFDYLYF